MSNSIAEKYDELKNKIEGILKDALQETADKYKEHIRKVEVVRSPFAACWNCWIETTTLPAAFLLFIFLAPEGCTRKELRKDIENTEVYNKINEEVVDEMNKRTVFYRFMVKKLLDGADINII